MTFNVDVEYGFKYYFSFENGGIGIDYTVTNGGIFKCEYLTEKVLFAPIIDGSYNCLGFCH